MSNIDFEAKAAAGTCDACGRALRDEYWSANGRVACTPCKTRIGGSTAGGSLADFVKAATLGLIPMLIGAILWWAVARFVHLQAAIVAIGIGWGVGAAVRAGAGGRGGLPFQVLAVLETYASIVLAYVLLIATELGFDQIDIVKVFLIAPVAPFLGKGPGVILTIAIIGFGLWRAWRITGSHEIAWSGPHRIGSPPPLPEQPPAP